MKSKIYIPIILIAGLVARPILASLDTKSNSSINREYKIKAAFLYNFLKTIDWPKETAGDTSKPMIIGIIGKERYGKVYWIFLGQRGANATEY